MLKNVILFRHFTTSMTRNTRRVLFYLGVIIFVCTSYISFQYAQGYKYSFSQRRFIHTGAISLKVNDDAKVFVDDKLDGSTSFLGNTHTVDGLLPGNYVVRLDREGFTPWQKTVTVEEGFITDFPRIIILPISEEEAPRLLEEFEEILASPEIITPTPTPTPSTTPKTTPRITRSPSISPSGTASASLSPTPTERFILENKILYFNDGGTLKVYATNVTGYSLTDNGKKILWWYDRDLWVAWLDDTDYQPYKKEGDRELVTRFATPIKKAAWFRGQDHVLADTNGFKVVEIDKRGGQNIIKI